MYQIGQFAKLMDISPRMLRHYEKAGIFVPNEIDKKTGRQPEYLRLLKSAS